MTPERYARICRTLNRRQPDLTVVMEDVHKAHNLAAICRSADAVGIGEIHGVTADPTIRLTHRSASGTNKWVTARSHGSIDAAVAQLREAGLSVVVATPGADAVDYREADYTAPTALLVGAELVGISARAVALADTAVTVPMAGMAGSLNVSVATALILFEAMRQREARGLYDVRRLDDATHARLLFEWSWPQVAAVYRRRGRPYPQLDECGDPLQPICDDVVARPPGSGPRPAA
ncbi:MAG: tRNA (guanosine(18)-2'-O)-methyltransferase TrmH [Gammaproteobacteria bacterium]|nr:tRNA (guanosine(18)-2'-O)-methyltransferase TrmH [Gammaproteobacteria bacterium]NNL99995.1 tRNA (guanosine(18)-2'-O)-methyltransferase TrmH [Gammaproteobacteria bacterium]